MSLRGQIIAITGASSGLGQHLAEQAASRGMHLAIMARNDSKLHVLAKKIGGDILVFSGDVTSEDDCKKFINATIDKFGSMDHLITNAGQSMWTNFDEIEQVDLFRKLMDVNFMGVVNCIHPSLDSLKKASGQVVVISSIQSKFGVPAHSAYSASKHALEGLIDSLRFELQSSKINFMIVYPHWIRGTEMRQNALGSNGKKIGNQKRNHNKSSVSAEDCARNIIDALPKRRKSLFIPGKLKYLPALKLLLPPVFRWLIRSKIKSQK
jgi:short-subunit dehydrogenase